MNLIKHIERERGGKGEGEGEGRTNVVEDHQSVHQKQKYCEYRNYAVSSVKHYTFSIWKLCRLKIDPRRN